MSFSFFVHWFKKCFCISPSLMCSSVKKTVSWPMIGLNMKLQYLHLEFICFFNIIILYHRVNSATSKKKLKNIRLYKKNMPCNENLSRIFLNSDFKKCEKSIFISMLLKQCWRSTRYTIKFSYLKWYANNISWKYALRMFMLERHRLRGNMIIICKPLKKIVMLGQNKLC